MKNIDKKPNANFKDLTGKIFDRLTVIKRVENDKSNRTMWLCKCSCGKEIIVRGSSLTSGNSKSCGCYRDELLKTSYITHNQSKTRLYKIWAGIKSRCTNPKSTRFENYGGRGITFYKEWENFESFYEWAVNNDYEDNLTIERIDNNGNYEPSNCRWVDYYEQSHNKRNNVYFTYKNETHCLREWANILNIKPMTLYNRYRKGWSVERMLSTPVLKNYRNKRAN